MNSQIIKKKELFKEERDEYQQKNKELIHTGFILKGPPNGPFNCWILLKKLNLFGKLFQKSWLRQRSHLLRIQMSE
jgi:hypothetical protein